MMRNIFILLLLSIKLTGYAQSMEESPIENMEKPKDSGEELILETDRQFYCVNENIYFTVGYKFIYPIDNVQWSNVLYVELIRWNGEKIAQAKFKLTNNIANGSLAIPETVLSGNYYVRAYTRWMRNYPTEYYSYRKVKIINPFDSKIDQGPVINQNNQRTHSVPLKRNVYNGIECFTDKSTYNQREKVDLTFQLKNQAADYSNFCVSVAKAASADTNIYFIQIPDDVSPGEKSIMYLPEYRGISISGKILNADTTVSVENASLHLSMPQNWKYFTTFQTKNKGLFYFTLPDYYGHFDFYLDAVLENGESAEVLVDNDYCNRSIQLDYIPFSLDPAERKIAMDITVNMQLSKMYNEKNSIDTTESSELPFFGKPKHLYSTEAFIPLPSLEEFFFELVKEVRVIRSKKEATLKLTAYSQYQHLDPLILLDNIPVADLNEFLKIPSDRIEKIEIFDEPYIVAGTNYSGVICVSTKRKDFAGNKLNKNSLFFAYDLLSEGIFDRSEYSSTNANRHTDRRNLLFWDPDIELIQNQLHTLSFYTSDSKGEYTVHIRSLNTWGKPQIYGTCNIMVE